MDLKDKIEESVEKLKSNPQSLAKFQTDPVGALEGLTGIDLPDDQIKPLVAGIKAKLGVGDVSDVIGKIGKLF